MSNRRPAKDAYDLREVGDPKTRKCSLCGGPRHAYPPRLVPAGANPAPVRLCPVCDQGPVETITAAA